MQLSVVSFQAHVYDNIDFSDNIVLAVLSRGIASIKFVAVGSLFEFLLGLLQQQKSSRKYGQRL